MNHKSAEWGSHLLEVMCSDKMVKRVHFNKNQVVPTAQTLFPHEALIFLDDKAHIDTARLTEDWSQKDHIEVNCLPLPPK